MKLRFLTVILATLIAPSIFILPSPAVALNTNIPLALNDCSVNKEVPCIQKMSIRLANGNLIAARLTGRTGLVEKEFAGNGYPEYEVSGVAFEEPSKGKFIARLIFYPYSTESNCEKNSLTCGKETEFLQIGIQPSWLDQTPESSKATQLILPHRKTSLLCGPVNARNLCNRSNNFLKDLNFIATIQVPNDFNPIWISGSSKNVRLDNWQLNKIQGTSFSSLNVDFGTLKREMVLFSDYYENPIAAIDDSPYADYQGDWPNLWINGSKDRSLGLVGSCRNIPFVSVVSNSIYQEIPFWNTATNSIDIKLYASHFGSDGKINYGFYELNISTALAKCFWGIDVTSKTQAKIVIYYPDSTEGKIVETLETKLNGNIFTAKATNFTFSNPTIKVQLYQPALSQAKPTPSQLPQKQTKKSVKITCMKGNQKKTVSGLNPKCPTGYKKT